MFQIMFWNMIFWNMCSAMFQNMCSKLCSRTWFFGTCVLACSRTCVLNMILEHDWPCPFKYLDKLVKFLYILCRPCSVFYRNTHMNMFYVPNHVLELDFLENVFFLKFKIFHVPNHVLTQFFFQNTHRTRTRTCSMCVFWTWLEQNMVNPALYHRNPCKSTPRIRP